MSERREIRCLGIVNRGEAAMRCIRAVKALRTEERSDLRALALYTEVERDAPFVRHADFAVTLRPAATEVAAYLDHDGILDALRRGGADAVWPGWGFVAEDPVFVERLEREGIVFLGPPASAMRALGDKIAAKLLAEANDVPVSPWSGREVEGDVEARACAERIGFPLVIKATAGGGGRGIRVVEKSAGLSEALRSARAEALSAVRGWRGRHGDVPGFYREGPYVAPYGEGGGKATALELRHAMQIDWMTDHFDLREAIPPAYAEYIGRSFLSGH